MQTVRQIQFPTWHHYGGKVFRDPGTRKGEDPDNPEYSLRAGLWMVGSVTEGNCFEHYRLRQEHRPENNVVFDIGYVMRRIRKYEEE